MVALDGIIHDVWASNFDTEFANLRKVVRKSSCVIPFIEFPGLCMTPLGTFFTREQFTYQQLIVNVNALKPIQLGFTFVPNTPAPEPSFPDVYQFNLHFDLSEDMFTDEAIQAYQDAGINFSRHSADGIRLLDFGELLTTSGLIASPTLTWASFHSAFDFGFLTRSLYGGTLPPDIRVFHKLFNRYFATVYDIKQLLRLPEMANRGFRPDMSLQEVADALEIKRVGKRHVAASDSMLAANVFTQLKNDLQLQWSEISKQINGVIYGIADPVLPHGAVIQSIFSTKTANQLINNCEFDRRRPFSSIPQ